MNISLIKLVGLDNYYDGTYYTDSRIKFKKREFDTKKNLFLNAYDVKDIADGRKYRVTIMSNGSYLDRFSCDCVNYAMDGSCEHVAAVLNRKWDAISKCSRNVDLTYGKMFLNRFKGEDNSEVSAIRKHLNYIVEFEFDYNEYRFRLKIGDDRFYILTKSKLNTFLSELHSGDDFVVGKMFTYNSNKYYLDDKLTEIIRFITDKDDDNSGYYGADLYHLSRRDFNSLLNIVGSDNVYIKGYGRVNGVKHELPKVFKLTKDDDNNYVLSLIRGTRSLIRLGTGDYIYKNILYIPGDENNEILSFFNSLEDEEVKFSSNDLDNFKNGVFKDIRNNLIIDDSVSEIALPTKPIVNIYFDLDSVLTARVVFDYNGVLIDYFDNNSDNSYLRSMNDEKAVIRDLVDASFREENNKFIIDDDDIFADFMENYLPMFTEKYNVFLNKNMKSVNVLKGVRVDNNFSIGKDNILSYKFSIEGLDNKEINGIIKSIKKHKRYYRLRNNDLISLNDSEELNEFSDIVDDFGLSRDDLNNGVVSVPKYRALYIDSLKSNGNVHTDNVFDKFIDKFKKYKDTDIKLSAKDKKIYRDYQVDGVKWLYSIYKCDLGGILADEMGLGKTLQTIGLIKLILKEKKDAKVLIVSPTSLVYNWEKEFMKFAPELKYVAVADNKKNRQDIFNRRDEYNVFITSYGLIRNDNDEYEKMDFELCIIDEAQAIKNYKAIMTREVKKIKAKCKIALTGTPVENNIFELWSIFDFIMPGYLNSITKFREKYNFVDINDEAKKKINSLHEMIAPFILRRKKKDVLEALPDKIENKIYVELDDSQKAVYLKDLDDTSREMNDLIASGGYRKSQFKILALLTRLREICIDPSVVYDNYKGSSVKMDTLIDIVKENIENGHKILIFSSFKRILYNVRRRFDSEGITSYMIDGGVKSKDRVSMVDSFNSDDTNCFLITLKAGGTGLNLTGADTVIHLDIWWNPQVENQATDRAHRIGQKNKVNVIKIITKGTIEERIIELQEKKKYLADNLIESNGADKVISSLTEEDIRKLLAYND